jgi:hypothetical protein
MIHCASSVYPGSVARASSSSAIDAARQLAATIFGSRLRRPTMRSSFASARSTVTTKAFTCTLKPRLAQVTLRKLNAADITSAYAKVRGKGLSGQSCLHVHRVLHTALEYGTKALGWLRANPAAAVRSPRLTRRALALDEHTIPLLLEAAKRTRFECPVALAAMSGFATRRAACAQVGQEHRLRAQASDCGGVPRRNQDLRPTVQGAQVG